MVSSSEKGTKKRGASPKGVIYIDLTGENDDDPSFGGIASRGENARKRRMMTGPDPKNSVADINDEVQLVDAPIRKPKLPTGAAGERKHQGDEDVVLVGTVNEQRFPHMRQHCVDHEYGNRSYCDLCYCFVCDILASECKSWEIHHRATDRGSQKQYWRSKREQCRQQMKAKGSNSSKD